MFTAPSRSIGMARRSWTLRIRYQADNDLRRAIVRGVVRREPEIDFRSAQTARLEGAPEEWENRLCLIPGLVTIVMGYPR